MANLYKTVNKAMETNVFSENIHARGKALLCNKLNALSDVKNTLHTARKAGKAAVIASGQRAACTEPTEDDDQHNHQCCELAADKEMERTELRFTEEMVQFYSNFGSLLNPFWQPREPEPQARCPDIEDAEWIRRPFLGQDESVFNYEDVRLCVPLP